MHTLCLGIGRLIRWGSCGDPESYAAARGVWFPNRPIIIVIKWVRFLSSFFISSNSATETIACWASWFFILVYDLVRIRLLNRGEAFLGAIVNYLFEGKTMGWSDHACKDCLMRPSSADPNLPESYKEMHSLKKKKKNLVALTELS